MILAGDIGGTKTNLALFDAAEVGEPLQLRRFSSKEHSSLDEIVGRYTAELAVRVDRACFGVAGPVRANRTEGPNLRWVVDGSELSQTLGGAPVTLINDLEANAFGLSALRPDDVVVLQPGDPAPGNQAIIAAGTGLGEAGLYWDGTHHLPLACEGGHCDFAPQDELEIELLRWLQQRFEHVSYERVVSGQGLRNLYEFLRDTGRGNPDDAVDDEIRATEERGEDTGPLIGAAGLDGRCPLCASVLDLAVRLYGAEAGNLALKVLARGGLYVGGGIAPRILRKLQTGGFLEAFNAKGRMRPLMESLPVRVILNDRAALLGAAVCASRRG